MNISKKLTYYFYTILLISILLTLFGNNKYDIYGIIFYMLAGMPFFFLTFYSLNNKFSAELKKKRPNLFEKYKLHYSVRKGQIIGTSDLFNNKDFENLDDSDLLGKYKVTLKSLKYSRYSFLLVILVSGIWIIKKEFI